MAALLGNGMGGFDWAGLPLVCAWLGITDVDGLLYRLRIIRLHRDPEDDTDKGKG